MQNLQFSAIADHVTNRRFDNYLKDTTVTASGTATSSATLIITMHFHYGLFGFLVLEKIKLIIFKLIECTSSFIHISTKKMLISI